MMLADDVHFNQDTSNEMSDETLEVNFDSKHSVVIIDPSKKTIVECLLKSIFDSIGFSTLWMVHVALVMQSKSDIASMVYMTCSHTRGNLSKVKTHEYLPYYNVQVTVRITNTEEPANDTVNAIISILDYYHPMEPPRECAFDISVNFDDIALLKNKINQKITLAVEDDSYPISFYSDLNGHIPEIIKLIDNDLRKNFATEGQSAKVVPMIRDRT